ncbi:MAG: C39 family peptidase, partial [Candidatus Levyibacteriota bacterium]
PTPTPAADTSPTPTPDNSGAINDLQNKIKDYEGKISDLQSQEKTFSSQIEIMNNQISLTELKIQAAQEQLAQMEKDIEVTKQRTQDLEKNITASTKALIGRIGATYQVGTIDPWQVFLTSDNISNFLTRLTYLKLVQANDRKNIYAAQQDKANYQNEKTVLEEKQKAEEAVKAQLVDYTTQLDQDKAAKQALLDQTKGSEANYQRLLAAAQAQLAGFSNFTANQGGASLLSGQTTCDSWGCYYNQRDSQWGGNSLNGTQYTIASDGCLVTSMAMIYTHYGHRDVTPTSINSNSNNFASYYPAYLLYTISANGTSSSRNGAAIDSTLSSGNPVVVGIHAYGGTHFVVLKSGSNGDYVMNDPFVPNGHDLKFTDYYSTGSIFEVDRVSF